MKTRQRPRKLRESRSVRPRNFRKTVHKFFRCLKRWKFRVRQLQWKKNGTRSRKFQRGIWRKVKSKRDVVLEAQKRKRKVHSAALMDICHLKNVELEQKHRKYKGRVVLRGHFVKDDSGAHVVFTEQGSSASSMTAVKVMDVIARWPGCAGHAADAVSVSPRLTWRMLPDCSEFQSLNVQMCGYIFHELDGPNPGQTLKTQCFFSNELCTVTRLLASCGKRPYEEVLLGLGWQKVPNCECLLVLRKQELCLSEHAEVQKMAGRKHNMAPMWK